MTQVAVRAYAFAATFRLRELHDRFPGAAVEQVVDELHVRYPDGTVALVYDFGALVVFGGEASRDRIAAAVARGEGRIERPFTEDFLVVVDPEAPAAGEVRFDRVVVRELSPAVQAVVALLVAQSAAMDFYTDDVASVLAWRPSWCPSPSSSTGPRPVGGDRSVSPAYYAGNTPSTRTG